MGFYLFYPGPVLWEAAVVCAGLFFLGSSTVSLRTVDLWLILTGGFEIFVYWLSQYRANSFRALPTIAFFVLFYFVARLTIRTATEITALSGVLGLVGCWLAISAVDQFHAGWTELQGSGLTDIVAFRAKLISPPHPWLLGEWLTLLLLLLPIASALPCFLWFTHRKHAAAVTILPPVFIVSTLALSLSRAAFWSTALFLASFGGFLALSRLLALRNAAKVVCGSLGALVLILVIEGSLFPGLLGAYVGRQTSQVRSTEGRLAIWHRAVDVVHSHPIAGVGSANSALALTSSADVEETRGFASRTFSLPIQVLVEKGIVGFLLYAVAIVIVAREGILGLRIPTRVDTRAKKASMHKTNLSAGTVDTVVAHDSARKAMSCCFAAGLLAVLARELFYSSLMEHILTLALFGLLCGLLVDPNRSATKCA